MNVVIASKFSRNKAKKWYYFEWGKQAGQRVAANIFTSTKATDHIQRNQNKKALMILETKKSQLILETQAIGTGYIPGHRYKSNFLDFYEEFAKTINKK